MANAKFSREQCRQRYVYGEAIGLRSLSALSCVSQSSLERWSSQEKWTEQRREYHLSLREKTEVKALEKTSDRLSEHICATQTEHFEDYRVFRKLVMVKARFLAQQCREDQPQEHLEAQLDNLSGATLNMLNVVLDRSVKGERVALGLEYEDYNKAIKLLTSAGFEVSVPEDIQEFNQAVVGQPTDGQQLLS